MSNTNNVYPMQATVPPKGDEQKAEKYISDLMRLIEQGKVQVNKTDLSQFNPSSLQNHYRLDLEDFQIEISHSAHLETGANSYVIIFNNLKNIADGSTEKAILAYIHLTEEQYRRFHHKAEEQIDKLKKIEDEKRFIQAVQPLDNKLAELEQSNKDIFSEKLAEAKNHNHHEPEQVDMPQEQTQQEEEPISQDPWTPAEERTSSVENNNESWDSQETYQEEQTLGTHPAPRTY